MTPNAEAPVEGNDGLKYHVVSRANMAAGEQVPVTIRYAKTDSGVSAPQLAVTANEAASAASATAAETVGSSQANDWLPYLLIGLGVALLFGALAYWYLARRRPTPAPAPTQSTSGKRSAARATSAAPKQAAPPVRPSARANQSVTPAVAPPAPVSAGAAAFCTQCGNPLRPDDRFCSQCGTAGSECDSLVVS
jgi:hypothetical protein